jgi:hypothetical protein
VSSFLRVFSLRNSNSFLRDCGEGRVCLCLQCSAMWKKKKTDLHTAAQRGESKTLRKLLAKGSCDVNETKNDDQVLVILMMKGR